MATYLELGFDQYVEKKIPSEFLDYGIDQKGNATAALGVSDSGEGVSNITSANAGIKLQDTALDFDKLNIEKLYTNQNLQSSNFISGSAGWQIQGNGNVEFNDGTFRGALTAATIDIGGSDATSFHVDIDGNMWLGAATFNISTNPFAVSNAGVIRAVSGTIGGWTLSSTTIRAGGSSDATANVLIDSGNTLIRLGPTSGNSISLDGANLRIRSSNYSAGVSGFTVEPTLIEAQNLRARGEMSGMTFRYDVVSAVGGQLIVSASDVLASDMTAAD